MIYCPHCKKPSARETGPCPHCKKDLSGAAPLRTGGTTKDTGLRPQAVEVELEEGPPLDIELARVSMPPRAAPRQSPVPAPTPAAQPAMPVVVARPSLPEDDEDSLPELETVVSVVPPPAAAPARSRADASRDDVARVAAFGTPDAGLMGAVRYALRVRARLMELKDAHDKAKVDREAAGKDTLALFASLGRQAREVRVESGAVTERLSVVEESEKALGATQGRKSEIEAAHHARLRELERQAKAVEVEAEPVHQEEKEGLERLERLRNERRRAETKLKRAEIELRNIFEVIEKRQKDYADLSLPKDERARLLADIAAHDKQQPPLFEEVKKREAEIAALTGPLAEAEKAYAEVRVRLEEKMGQVSRIRHESNRISREFERETAAVESEIGAKGDSLQKAWATVGRAAYACKEAPEAWKPVIADLRKALDEEVRMIKKVESLAAALDSYDRRVVEKGWRVMIGAAVVAGLIVVAAFVAIVT
ncbi:MAG: hypothetical protein PHU25_18890 [Deltaproteobacteria bacterium]|nr:hypothetical protein [Deltaproteobacteria bacterium]